MLHIYFSLFLKSEFITCVPSLASCLSLDTSQHPGLTNAALRLDRATYWMFPGSSQKPLFGPEKP